jgi:hypothetical protein
MARYIMVVETANDAGGGEDGEKSVLSSTLRMIAYRVQTGQAGEKYCDVQREDGYKMGRFRLIRDDRASARTETRSPDRVSRQPQPDRAPRWSGG